VENICGCSLNTNLKALDARLMQVFFSHEPKSAVSSRLWQEMLQLPRLHLFQVCSIFSYSLGICFHCQQPGVSAGARRQQWVRSA
jgi:hypothetical protein